MQPTLENLKHYVYADDMDYDDEMLEGILSSVLAHCVRDTQRSEEDIKTLGGGQWPADFGLGVIALASLFYKQREPVSESSMQRVPMHAKAFLKPFRILGKTTCD